MAHHFGDLQLNGTGLSGSMLGILQAGFSVEGVGEVSKVWGKRVWGLR